MSGFVLTGCKNTVQSLPQTVKDEINRDFTNAYTFGGDIIWYDEYGSEDMINVWRYIGKYGDCYAFIWTYPHEQYLGYVPEEYLLDGLFGEVMYPRNSRVMLYHTKQEFTFEEMYEGSAYGFPERSSHCGDLTYLKNRKKWLTDSQWVQLTRDIEKMAKGRV